MRTIELVKNKENCCACNACLNICPKKAIEMKADKYGFMYPMINEKKCVSCGLCIKVCSFQKNGLPEYIPLETYAAVSKNTDVLKSASGGIFAGFARKILEEGGVVFGASLEQREGQLVPMHIAVDEESELIKLQGSKYVQSNIGNTYAEVKKQLEKGKKVLFSGTPCQVDGLRGFLKKGYDDLYLMDIICHGVPGAKFFQDYIELLEKKYENKIIDFKFRDKTQGWGLNAKIYFEKSREEKEEVLLPCYQSSYYQLFLESATYRENCYTCKYTSSHRVGDITIGDFWGIEEEHPELLEKNGGILNEKSGVSCLIVNTEKGRKLLMENKENILLVESKYENVEKHNEQLRSPSRRNPKREHVLELYKNKGMGALDQEFEEMLYKKEKLKKLTRIIPDNLKVKIKHILKI